MEDDPYEIWREALADIENQKRLADQYEFLEFREPDVLGRAVPGQANPEVLARAWEILEGDKMDEEKESYTKLVRKTLVWRGIFLVITISIIGLLTIALIDGKLNAWEFLAASIVWFGLSLLFVWGTDMPKKEQEDAGE